MKNSKKLLLALALVYSSGTLMTHWGRGYGWGGGWGWGGWGGFGGGFGPGGFGDSTTRIENQRVAHLVLDIFDSTNHHLLFRGVTDRDLSNNSGNGIRMVTSLFG